MTKIIYILIPFSVFGSLSIGWAQPGNLLTGGYGASGQGNKTTIGAIQANDTVLFVKDVTTWQPRHGIRIRRAGSTSSIHSADSGWVASHQAPVTVVHDAARKRQGMASVECNVAAGSPPIPAAQYMDLCEVALGSPVEVRGDEVRLWVKPSVAVPHSDLRIALLRPTRDATYELPLPALPAGKWTEVFLELKKYRGNLPEGQEQIVVLQCLAHCDQARSFLLDDISVVRDHVTTVKTVKGRTQTRPPRLVLSDPANRQVIKEIVYHDDSKAVTRWLATAKDGVPLVAPAGTYYISYALPGVGNTSLSLPVYNRTRITCVDPQRTIFKNTGRSETGVAIMFRSAEAAAEDISIEHCGFDWNGWNAKEYAFTIDIAPHSPGDTGHNIVIRHNHFIDSALPGLQGCDVSQDACITRQRVDIYVPAVDRTWIEHNQHSSGGRIKAGGPGSHIWIRNNTLSFVNDNAIAIVSTQAGITEHVDISDNTIIDAITSGIFFGADGEQAGVPGMIIRHVTIARNHVSGFFITAGIWGMLPEGATDIYLGQNVVESKRDRVATPGTVGIGVRRVNAATMPASGVIITQNAISASGAYGGYPLAAILLGGPVNDSAIRRNFIQGAGNQPGSSDISLGVWLSSGPYVQVTVEENVVMTTQSALEFGLQTASGVPIHIINNTFTDSLNPSAGQININSEAGNTVHADLVGNHIQNGKGFGIFCTGMGTTQISNFLTNTVANNVQGDKSATCPP
jgi:hypothetical protein